MLFESLGLIPQLSGTQEFAMPVCQKCNSPYDEWQHFCLHCGESLKAALPPSHRCPQCGTEVALDRTFCHVCAVTQKDDTSHPNKLISRWAWLTGGLIALLVIFGIIFAFYFLNRPRWVPAPVAESPTTSPPVPGNRIVSREGKAPGTRSAVDSLQGDLEEILNRIKEANLKKNILLYMGTLSAQYPQAEKKRQEVSKTWEKFDFKQMAFSVNKLQEVDGNNAIAEVKWTTTAQNKTTGDLQTGNFYYRVRLTKELGQWKINKIEELPPGSLN